VQSCNLGYFLLISTHEELALKREQYLRHLVSDLRQVIIIEVWAEYASNLSRQISLLKAINCWHYASLYIGSTATSPVTLPSIGRCNYLIISLVITFISTSQTCCACSLYLGHRHAAHGFIII